LHFRFCPKSQHSLTIHGGNDFAPLQPCGAHS
jgi:hypothetical protein